MHLRYPEAFGDLGLCEPFEEAELHDQAFAGGKLGQQGGEGGAPLGVLKRTQVKSFTS